MTLQSRIREIREKLVELGGNTDETLNTTPEILNELSRFIENGLDNIIEELDRILVDLESEDSEP